MSRRDECALRRLCGAVVGRRFGVINMDSHNSPSQAMQGVLPTGVLAGPPM